MEFVNQQKRQKTISEVLGGLPVQVEMQDAGTLFRPKELYLGLEKGSDF